jgi:osmotically inducible protein OsmC
MTTVRSARAEWNGNLTAGKGRISLESGAFDGNYDFRSRFEGGRGTNPEELIAAAHAGCFSMALAHGLTSAGHAPNRITTTARVHIEKKEGAFVIPLIELETEGDVPGIDDETFQQQVQTAKKGCPVSKALAGPEIRLTGARLAAS